nr:reverse transcriptase domain-containing protein [Tanacetum cinerariifolium]
MSEVFPLLQRKAARSKRHDECFSFHRSFSTVIFDFNACCKSPYQLAPTEMQELSNQLKELQEKANSEGIHVDPNKIEAVKNWKPLKTPIEIRSFLGSARYYRRFIASFLKMAKPLTLLTQKNKKFEWGDEQENAFQTLKDMLCDAPILALLEGANDFVVYCKANVVADALSRKERAKPRRVRAISMTIHSSIKAKILEAQSEASKKTSTPTKKLKGLDKQLERNEDGRLYLAERIWVPVYGNMRTLIMNEAHATRLYINEIIARHGVPVSIISDRDSYFTSKFWKSLQKALGTRLDLSTAYHPKTDGQSERTIQTLEDMLRAYAMDFGGNWDTHLLLVEFSYNNSYHSSIKCAPFEALYEIVQETTDKIVQIKERFKVARDRQKSYADKRRKPLKFSVSDKVLLKVSPRKGVVRI